jgi:hypothetical protein
MRAIDGAVALGQQLQRPVNLVWTANASAGCRFSDLFERPDELADVRECDGFSSLNIDWPKIKSRISLRSPPSIMCQAEVERWLGPGADVSWMKLRPRLHFKTHWRLLNLYSGRQIFRPLPCLQERINSMLPVAKQCIGVHIRRGDHLPSRRYSPSSLFERRLDRELEREPGVRFFLVTDDADEEARFSQRYLDAIIAPPKTSRERACQVAIEDALVDLFTLAQTRHILGSAASSFSIMARDLFGAPMEVVSEELPDKLDW